MKYLKVFLISILVFCGIIAGWGQNKTIENFLPVNEIEGWQPMGETLIYEGDDLFFLINGGADIYLEFGFGQVISRNYTDETGNILKVELYEMLDEDAAFGIYSLFKIDEGTTQFAQAGRMSDTHVRFRTNRYFGIIMLQTSNPNSNKSMVGFAKFLLNALPGGIENPKIADMLPDEGFISLDVKYFRGNIGLSNVYGFGSGDIFGFSEGVYGNYGSHSLIILKYEDNNELEEITQKIHGNLMNNKKFSDFEINELSLKFKDSQGLQIVLEGFENYLLIYLGEEVILQPELFERIRGGDINELPDGQH